MQTTKTAAQLATSLRFTTVTEKDAKKAADTLFDMHKHVAQSEKGTDDALRRCTKMSQRARLSEGQAFDLRLQHRKIGTKRCRRDSSIDDRLKEVSTLAARLHMLCDKLDSRKRRQATNRELKVITCKVGDV